MNAFIRDYSLRIELFQELVFLGTGSGYPSPHRGASALVLRDLDCGDQWLFDCGEGTQIQAQKSTYVRMGRISHIFISHLHGDHMFGLPGFLCTIDQRGTAVDAEVPTSRTDGQAAVNIYGPQGLRRFLRLALALSRSHLKYTYAVHELILRDEHTPTGWEDWGSLIADSNTDPPLHCELPGKDIEAAEDGFWYDITTNGVTKTTVHAVALRHTIPSVGWLIVKPMKSPPLCLERARALGVPDGPLMGDLKRRKTVVINGRTIDPEEVLGAPIRGHQLAIMGDSYDSSSLLSLMSSLKHTGRLPSMTLDALVHEATLENKMADDARLKGHSTPSQVTALATAVSARLLILTHFSQRYTAITVHKPDGTSDDSFNVGDVQSDRPSLQLLLDEAKNSKFDGDVLLADDFVRISVPSVPKNK